VSGDRGPGHRGLPAGALPAGPERHAPGVERLRLAGGQGGLLTGPLSQAVGCGGVRGPLGARVMLLATRPAWKSDLSAVLELIGLTRLLVYLIC
jgi:hypothetical protein